MRTNIRNDYERGAHISGLWEAVERKVLSWPQAQKAQTVAMPTCDRCHKQPAIVKHRGEYLCADCYIGEQA